MLSQKLTAAAIAIIGITLASATESHAKPSLGALCDAHSLTACQQLAEQTNGLCASPGGLGGCRFDSLSFVTND